MVSKYLAVLVKKGILKRYGGKFLVQNNIKTKSIRILLNLSMFDNKFLMKYKFIKGAGLYGSFTKGTNTEYSDIDLWILTKKTTEIMLAKVTNDLKKTFGNVKPLFLTEDKIKLLKKEDVVFYHSLIFGSIVIYGDGIEAI